MISRLTTTLGACSLVFVAGLLAIRLSSNLIVERAPKVGAFIVAQLKTEIIEPKIEAPASTSFIAVGDMMLSRTVAERMKKHGQAYPFAKTKELTTAVDFSFGNLETPIIAGRSIQPTEMVFRADPGVEQELKTAGFNIVSLANNHIMNFGNAGLDETIAKLDAVDIVHAGAGQGSTLARAPAIVESNGIRVAFLAYTYSGIQWTSESDMRYGPVGLSPDQVNVDVVEAEKVADIVVVSMHAGSEYAAVPNKQQTSFARSAIDAGADLVIGHHPHVVQAVEKYNGKFIIYSLGNFIFDQMWSQDTRHGMVAEVTLSKTSITDLSFKAVIIDDFAQPRLADPEEAGPILDRLNIPLQSDGQVTDI